MSFRVQNFRNVDDSGWVDLDRVTALVGRNESGKTALLQALHKFNPATRLSYQPQREFPRDRFQREFSDAKATEIPVCSIRFAIEGDLRRRVDELTTTPGSPATIEYTRYYGGNLSYLFDPIVPANPVNSDAVDLQLEDLASLARRLDADGEAGVRLEATRGPLLAWVATRRQSLPKGNLRSETGRQQISSLLSEVQQFARPETAEIVERFSASLKPLAEEAGKPAMSAQVEALCARHLPVFIYFENYGILDSAVHLSRFIEDQARTPDDPRVRTINAMFQHVRLSAKEIADLGRDTIGVIRQQGRAPTAEELRADQEAKELRAIRLNAASNDITDRFGRWWHQRRHRIVYTADADFFRIWVSDDRRPDVNIELESRSKGFQWFFSFYLVFLVESEGGHRDAVLLLDEPGLNLHMTAQAELLTFFDELAERNQLIYTTHSASLVDARRLTRVRIVRETTAGRSEVGTDVFPEDRETYMPVQAALGYDLVQTMFHGRRAALLEGAADMLHLSAMDLLLRANGRAGLPTDVMLVPSEGTKMIGVLASIYIGQGVRPVVVLDSDEAGRAKESALSKELYRGEERALLLVSDAVPGCLEIEDVVGEEDILANLSQLLGIEVVLEPADRAGGRGVVDAIAAWAQRTEPGLPPGWKLDVAYRSLRRVVEGDATASVDRLERAEALIREIDRRAQTQPARGRFKA